MEQSECQRVDINHIYSSIFLRFLLQGWIIVHDRDSFFTMVRFSLTRGIGSLWLLKLQLHLLVKRTLDSAAILPEAFLSSSMTTYISFHATVVLQISLKDTHNQVVWVDDCVRVRDTFRSWWSVTTTFSPIFVIIARKQRSHYLP